MKRWLFLGVFLIPTDALATGLGSSAGLGFGGLAGRFGADFDFVSRGFAPSFDLHTQPLVLQFHVLEFIDQLSDEEIYLGANLYFDVFAAEISGPWIGVVQPGVSIDLVGDPFIIGLAGECRLGAQAEGAMGFGIYVVPSLGFYTGAGDSDLMVGGTLQISSWVPL